MNKTKIEKFLQLRYFLSVFIVLLYFYYKSWIYVDIYYLDFQPFLISSILILIVNRWLYGILILLNVFILLIHFNYVIGRCLEKFPTNTFTESYNWLIDTPAFHWGFIFWVLQICLIVYLIVVETKIYKNKNSLV